MSTELTELAERLNQLETQNRKLKRFLALILLLAGAVLLMGQARPAPRTIEAEEFILKDSKGETRGRLSIAGEVRAPTLELRDSDNNKLVLTARADGSSLILKNGNRIASLAATSDPRVGPAQLFLASGSSGVGFMATPDHLDFSYHDKAFAALFVRANPDPEATLILRDNAGSEVHVGNTSLELPVTGAVLKKPASSVVLLGKDGKVMWSAP